MTTLISDKRFGFILLCLIGGLSLAQPLYGQDNDDEAPKKIEILNANTLKYERVGGEKIRKLIGDVKFQQEGVIMDCDSAYQYQDRSLIKAYDNIHIQQGDSIDLTGEFLRYSSESRKAVIKRNVVMEEESMTLETDTLHYEMEQSEGYYKNGGVIRDTANKLTSVKGFYHSQTKDVFFRDSVRLFNPDYTIFCDTLRYHTPTEKAYFYGPTEIISDSNFLYCENGWYNTDSNLARFGENTYLESGPQTLYADSLFYDRGRQYGKARFDIRLIDTLRNLTVTGQKGEYYENQQPSYVTDSVLARKIEEEDTLYLHSDTLEMGYDSLGKRLLKGYYGAKTFESGFQTQSDSLVYSSQDSIIYLYKNPTLWYSNYELSGEQVRIHTDGAGKVEKLVIPEDGLIIAQETQERFNQVRGRKVIGHFHDNELNLMDVIGNAESIYYLTDENDKYMGINKIKANNLQINFDEREIQTINFRGEPDGSFNPPAPDKPEKFRFDNFIWLAQERPNKISDLFEPFNTREAKEEPESDSATQKKSKR